MSEDTYTLCDICGSYTCYCTPLAVCRNIDCDMDADIDGLCSTCADADTTDMMVTEDHCVSYSDPEWAVRIASSQIH